MPEPSQFRHYQIVQDAAGANVEVFRDDDQVVVLAFDLHRQELVHCHVLLEMPADRAGFEQRCRTLGDEGHPLMARMAEFGEDDGNAFYITSNVDGEPLREYLERQKDLPVWLAVMLARRSLAALTAVCQRGDFLTEHPIDSLRVLQSGPVELLVMVSDYQVAKAATRRGRGLRPKFSRQASFLKAFLDDQAGGNPAGAEHLLPTADFTELLAGCLSSAEKAVVGEMQDLMAELEKTVSEEIAVEIGSSQKPKSVAAPLLGSYQEVARAVVNLVRIQSQRLDVTNPYGMRGTLTKTGRGVFVEQVPPRSMAGKRVLEIDQLVAKLGSKRGYSSLVKLALVHEQDGMMCLAEETVDGVHLGELLKKRASLNGSEAYLVLAGLDAALSQLEEAAVPILKLRMEDIFVLNGRPLGGEKPSVLFESKLTEWPSFSVMLRAQPCLASMTGRGTDPAILLGSAVQGAPESEDSPWQGHWLAAVGRFLLGLEAVAGAKAHPTISGREREAMERFLGDEIGKGKASRAASRGDFLARYARIIQHHDLVKPEVLKPDDDEFTSPVAQARPVSSPPVVVSAPKPTRVIESDVSPIGAASITPVSEKSTIGFAELLFQGADTPIGGGGGGGPIWEASQSNSQSPTLPAELLPLREEVPMWLRAAVFMGGSMVLGAILAHVTGEAIWEKKRAELQAARTTVDEEAVSTRDVAAPKPEAASPMLPVQAGDDAEPERPKVDLSVESMLPKEDVPKAVPVSEARPGSSLRDSLESLGGAGGDR